MYKAKKLIFYSLFSLSINLFSLDETQDKPEDNELINKSTSSSFLDKNKKYILPILTAAIATIGADVIYKFKSKNETSEDPDNQDELEGHSEAYKKFATHLQSLNDKGLDLVSNRIYKGTTNPTSKGALVFDKKQWKPDEQPIQAIKKEYERRRAAKKSNQKPIQFIIDQDEKTIESTPSEVKPYTKNEVRNAVKKELFNTSKNDEIRLRNERYNRLAPKLLVAEFNGLKARNDNEKMAKFITVKDVKENITKILNNKGYHFDQDKKLWVDQKGNRI